MTSFLVKEIKTSILCLGFGMLQLSDCGFEQVKTWRSNNIFREGIPLDKSQGKERIFIGILANVNLTECHRMAIFGYPGWAVYSRVRGRRLCHSQFCTWKEIISQTD